MKIVNIVLNILKPVKLLIHMRKVKKTRPVDDKAYKKLR